MNQEETDIASIRKRLQSEALLRMTSAEMNLLVQTISCTNSYVEFGSGEATIIAARLVKDRVISIDASREMIGIVAQIWAKTPKSILPHLIHVDIGDVKEWRYPTGEKSRHLWPSYHRRIWDHPDASDADVYLVDGRFRVACSLQVLQRCRADAVLIIHDYHSRAHYHIIEAVARKIVSVGDLSLFVRRPDATSRAFRELLTKSNYDPR